MRSFLNLRKLLEVKKLYAKYELTAIGLTFMLAGI